LANIVQKKTNILAEHGFYGLEGTTGNSVGALPNELAAANNYFSKIKSFAAKNDVEVVFFCAPFGKNNKNLSYITKLKKRVPELHNFAFLINDENMFHDSYHLNKKGAAYFTKNFITTVLQ
jgi:hypothetical protein